jgi:hypothetical protein
LHSASNGYAPPISAVRFHLNQRQQHPLQQRSLAVLRVKRRLSRENYPRVLVAFFVALSGGFAFLSSFLMLRFGLESMALRYPVSLGFGYLFFLFLLWVWLRNVADSFFDIPVSSGSSPSGGSGESLPTFKGEGGEFGGGGASGSFDDPIGLVYEDGSGDLIKDVGDPLAGVAEADELAIPIIVIVGAVAIASVSLYFILYVIYIAPLILAEVLVDGVLSYALFRRIKDLDSPHWIQSVFRKTFWPLLITAVLVAVVGYTLSSYAPGARSIGEAVKQISQSASR